MKKFCIYLRKSRADAEAELRGEGETLARHERILLDLANAKKLHIAQIYKEIVSGETIAARPVMQQLLVEVEEGIWDGVLVMEVERLARGDSIDQGIIAQTFKYSNTQIITPTKTYHPNNEFDEEYFEFGLFMSRREYKTINRRLQNGRLASAKEGKYLGNIPPYGYQRKKLKQDKGYTLEPIPEEAETVRYIFETYAYGEKNSNGVLTSIGRCSIAKRLNTMGVLSQRGCQWTASALKDILTNPVYIGKIRWKYRPSVKQPKQGKFTVQRPIQEDCIIVQGLHEPIISQKLWDDVQKKLSSTPPTPLPANRSCKNPLAGLIKCGKCGNTLQRRPYAKKNKSTLICTTQGCDIVSTDLSVVEEKLLFALDVWLRKIIIPWDSCTNAETNDTEKNLLLITLNKTIKELETLQQQLHNAHDLLEQGIYTAEIFAKRTAILKEKLSFAQKEKENLLRHIEKINNENQIQQDFIPKAEGILQVYYSLPDAQSKNELLKELVEKVIYIKTVNGRWHNSPDDFELRIFPKITAHR
ncbi:MAG: recombinase family protein [Epulopiscium sp.]|nr:recombinase family protein [Candidatus Epulonipiscium sp.]